MDLNIIKIMCHKIKLKSILKQDAYCLMSSSVKPLKYLKKYLNINKYIIFYDKYFLKLS